MAHAVIIMSNRFTEIVRSLRIARVRLVEENRAKKARAKRGSKPRAKRVLVFDSPELAAIFEKMPEGCKDLLR